MSKCFAFSIAVLAALTTSTALAGASGTYDPATGEITVDVDDVLNWYVTDTAGNVMTGSTPSGLPGAGGLVSDNDNLIGETKLTKFSYSLNLGNVAQTGLSDNGTLKIFWNPDFGVPIESATLTFK